MLFYLLLIPWQAITSSNQDNSRKGSTLDGFDDLSAQGQSCSVIETYHMKILWFKGG
jgi:hypothetical protein